MSLRSVIRAAAGKPRAGDEDPPEDEDRDNEPVAEEEDPPADESAEGEDDDEAEGEEDQEPEAEEDEDKPAEARARERKRIRAILSAPAAADHPRQAAHLAFNTDLSSPKAIGILRSAGRPARGGGFGGRMAREGNPNLGAGGAGGGKGSPDRLVEFARQQAEAKRGRRRA